MVYDLPAAISRFEDRDEEQSRASSAFEKWRNASRPLLITLTGIAGIGTTTLAHELARGLKLTFLDGVPLIDLNRFRGKDKSDPIGLGELDTDRAVEFLLSRLGAEPTWSGDPSMDCHHRWRTRTKGAELCIVVDNARDASEVKPLLPTSGSSVVIVTSYAPLAGLGADDAVQISVGPLDEYHALRLLVHTVGDRLNAGSDGASEFALLCSGLPAAIHCAAGLIRMHPHQPLPVLLDTVRGQLHEEGMHKEERIWNAIYGSLSPAAACLYRLLADVPGTTVTRYSAAAILGCGPRGTAAVLDELEAAGLIAETGGGFGTQRIQLQAPLYPHARRCAKRHGDEEERAGADRRTVYWYLRQGQIADERAAGSRLTLAPRVSRLPEVEDIPSGEDDAYQWREAYQWLEAERHTLYDCVALARRYGMDAEAWSLCEPLFTHYHDHPHSPGVVDAFLMGLEAAQREGNVRAVVRMRSMLAFVYRDHKRFDDAERELVQAFTVSRTLGDSPSDQRLHASVIEIRGRLREDQGRLAEAAADFEESLHRNEAINNNYGVMLLSYRLGRTKARLGEPERAAELLEDAHSMARRDRRQRMTARTGYALADVLRGQGQGVRARALYLESLDSARARHSDFDETRILDALASLAGEAGNPAERREYRRAAYAIRKRNGITS